MSINPNPSIASIEKSLTPHVVALLAGVTGFISIFHPGFQIPGGAEAAAAGVSFAGAIGIEIMHVFGYHKALTTLVSDTLWADQQAQAVIKDVTPLAPVVTQVADMAGYSSQLAKIEKAVKDLETTINGASTLGTVVSQASATPSA